MKFLFGIVILSVFLQLSYAITKEEAIQVFMAAVDMCKASTGVTEGDIEKVKTYEIAESREGKCFTACVMKKIIFMTPENKINKSSFMAGVDLMYADSPADAKKAEEIVDGCIDINDSDECEAAFKIASCLKAGRQAKGLVLKI